MPRKESLIFLTVCMVSGCHVCSGTAVDDCVCSQVGELGQSPQQPSSIWLQERTVRELLATLTNIADQPQTVMRSAEIQLEWEQTYLPCYSDNPHGPFSLCLRNWVQLLPDLQDNLCLGNKQRIDKEQNKVYVKSQEEPIYCTVHGRPTRAIGDSIYLVFFTYSHISQFW